MSRIKVSRVVRLVTSLFLIVLAVYSLQSSRATEGTIPPLPPTAKDSTMPTNSALPAIVSTAIDAANAHDTDAWLATFSDNGAVNDWGRGFAGHEAIRSWSDAEFIGVDVTLNVVEAHTSGDLTTVLAQVGGKGFNGPSHFTFTVHADRIALMRITA